MADGLIWANLRGVDGHGVSRLPSYLAMIKRGDVDLKAQPRLVRETAATFEIDGGSGFGPVAMMQALAVGCEKLIRFLGRRLYTSGRPNRQIWLG